MVFLVLVVAVMALVYCGLRLWFRYGLLTLLAWGYLAYLACSVFGR